MRANYDGSNLVFIACQPRSGSTLLQRILGTHPSIHTVSEPWVMLHPTYALQENGVQAEYDANLARTGLELFLGELPKGRRDYLEGLSRMFGYLYERVLQNTDAHFFLDKTPRYYFILPEIRRIFPEARFILLFRNPLAVLSSIFRTWVRGDLLKIARYQTDLLHAPHFLLEGKTELGDATTSIEYEDLVQDSRSEMRRICQHIGLDFEPGMIEYGREKNKWKFGDPEKVYEHSRPVTSSLQKWARTDDAQEWRLLRDYAEQLGEDTFEHLGYEYGTCLQTLEAQRPTSAELRYTFSLDWLLNKKKNDRACWERYVVRLFHEMRGNGISGVAHCIGNRVRSRIGRYG